VGFPPRHLVGLPRFLSSPTYCKASRTADLMCSRMANNIQEHRASLGLGNHTATKGAGSHGKPGEPPGALELAASFLAASACRDTHGLERWQTGISASCELAMEVDSAPGRERLACCQFGPYHKLNWDCRKPIGGMCLPRSRSRKVRR
jgi:hypothetical protein